MGRVWLAIIPLESYNLKNIWINKLTFNSNVTLSKKRLFTCEGISATFHVFLNVYTFVIFAHSMRPFFLTKCLKNFFFKSLHLSSCSKSVSQDYCWRWKQSIPELRGSNYSVIQLLSIICHTCRTILAIHSLLNSSHHLCEVKQTICKCHTHLFSWTTSPFPTHPLFSPLQFPTFFSFCVHRKDILHSPTSKRTTELSYWGKRANR